MASSITLLATGLALVVLVRRRWRSYAADGEDAVTSVGSVN